MFYVEPKKAFFFTNFKAFHFSLVPVFALQHYELFNSCSFAHMAHPQRGRLRRTQRPDLTFYFNFHRLHTTAGHEHCIRSAIWQTLQPRAAGASTTDGPMNARQVSFAHSHRLPCTPKPQFFFLHYLIGKVTNVNVI